MFETYFLYTDAQCPICGTETDGLKPVKDGVLKCCECESRFMIMSYSKQSTNENAGVYVRDETNV